MRTRKILIIEDDPIILYLYKTQFERAGFEVKVANNGEAGFYLLHKSPPDAVLLDLMMPKINGVQVLKSIRSSDAFSNIPVFVFTNVYLSDLAKEAKTAGATKIFDKAAIIPLDVLDAVREALDPGSSPSVSANPRSDSALSSEVARSFQQTAPKTINALRKTLLALSKSGEDGARVSRLSELYERVHTFAGGASAAGLRVLAEMSAALEALLSELSGRLEQVNVSTLRTVSHAVDFLDVLFTSPRASSELLLVSPLNALIVDDEIISRRAIIVSLERARLKWIESESPYLALGLLKNQPFDLVFLDVSMPEMDGFDVCLELRRFPDHKKTPVIFVTGLTDFESRSRSTLSGGTDLIAKPFLFTELAVKALNHGLKYRLTQSANSSDELAQGQTPQTRKVSSPTVFGDFKDSPNDESLRFSRENLKEVKSEQSSDENTDPSAQGESTVQAQSLGNGEQLRVEKSAGEFQVEDCGAGNSSATRPICVLTLDENGKIQMLNDAAGLMFGYQISEIKDRLLTSLLLQTNEKNISLETLTKFFGGKSPKSKISDRFLGKRKDGSTFSLNLSLSEIVVGGQRMFTGILRDLSRIDSAEKILPSVQPFAGEVGAETTKELVEQRQAEASWRRQCREMETVLEKQVGELAQTRQELQKAAADREEIEARAHTLASTCAGLPKQLIEHRKTEERLRLANQELQDRIEVQSDELTAIRNEFTETTEKCQQLEIKAAEVGAAHNALGKELMLRSQAEHSLRQSNDELQFCLEKQLAKLGQAQAELQQQTTEREVQQAGMTELKLAKELLADQLVERQQIERALRESQEELKKRVARQDSHLESLRAELERRSSSLNLVQSDPQKEDQACELAKLESLVQKQTVELESVQCGLRKETQAHQQSRAYATKLAQAQAILSEEVYERGKTEESLRSTLNELEQRIGNLTDELLQVQGLRNEDLKQRQQVAAQLQHLLTVEATLAAQLSERTQAEAELRKVYAKLEVFAKVQENDLGRLRCELESETASRRKAVEMQTALKEAHSEGQQRMKQQQEELEKELSLRQQAEAKLHGLADAQSALTRELAEHSKTVTALTETQAKLFCLGRKLRFED